MQKFLVKILKFVLLPFLIVVLSDLYISTFKNNIFYGDKFQFVFDKTIHKYKWVNALPKKNTILLGGNSMVRFGLNPRILNKLTNDTISYANIGFDARDPIETYYILKNLNLKNVSQFYFGIDPFVFTKVFYKNRYPYYYMDMNFIECLNYFRFHDNEIFFKKYLNLFEYLFFESKFKYKDNQSIPYYLGAKLENKGYKEWNENVYEKFEIEKYGWSEIQFVYLKKIALLCKHNKIEFYALNMPRRSDYRKSYLSDCKSIQKYFSDKLKPVFKVNNYIGNMDCLNNLGGDKLFINSAHLNVKGQAIFSEIFHKMTIQK
jgi:hypothetical protein